MSPLLHIDGVTRHFGKLTAVSDMEFSIAEGEVRGLIGPNGSGKTTLFNLISGFVKPNSGFIRFLGEDITALAPHRIAALGLVRTFQISTAYKSLTVAENIRMGFHLCRKGGNNSDGGHRDLVTARIATEQRLDAIMAFMGLSHAAHRPAGTLPGGSLRTLSIAVALAAAPRLLLLDEPLAGLNASEKAVVSARIRELKLRGISILLVEHDVKSVVSICEQLTVINFGRKIADGRCEDVTRDPAVVEAYIGVRLKDA